MMIRRSPDPRPSPDDREASGPAPRRAPLDWKIADLAWSILATLAYADVFDFPMREREVHHYLIGRRADFGEIMHVLDTDPRLRARVGRRDGMINLAGREGLQERRREREEIARQLRPAADRYAARIAALPFVRMVALTGALALDNTEASGDVDFLVVTAHGRLWLTRAMVVLVVRRAALEGASLCPNYLLSETALYLSDQDLYSAHELVQMVPLSGRALYWHMRRLNHSWVSSYLPNAEGLPPARGVESLPAEPRRGLATRLGEMALRLPGAGHLEDWERTRKIRRWVCGVGRPTEHGTSLSGTEERFGPDWCKGHFDHHASRTLRAFSQRLELLAEGWR
jgi:hypothetical protein